VGSDQVDPRAGRECGADVYAQAGITNPIEEIDAVECYVPFSWYEPMWMENLGFAEVGEGWKLTESGATGPDKKLPVNLGHACGGATQFFAMWVVGTDKP
jgi:acetyl-CoA C-acetyltransferase